jgi:general secretion pathway protein D
MQKRVIELSILIIFSVSSLFAKCESELFNIEIEEPLSINEILHQISTECDFSVIIKDTIAQGIAEAPISNLNLKNVSLLELFDNLLKERNLDYELSKNLLKIRYLTTKTFKIDYISTYREGRSNTDVTISSGSGSTGSDSSSGGSSGDSQTTNTGTAIDSSDKFDFWKSLEDDITYLLSSTYSMVKNVTLKPLVSREAGLITVTGNSEQMQKIEQYISKLQKRLQNQVLIDVKILSIELNKEKKVGIDWNNFLSTLSFNYAKQQSSSKSSTSNSGKSSSLGSSSPLTPPDGTASIISSAVGNFGHIGSNSFGISGSVSLTDIVNVLKENGDVKSISNPKILTLNNQPALISSGDDLFYKLQTRIINSNNDSTNDSSSDDVKSIFTGVLLDITPSISDNGEVILKVNPSITQLRSPGDLKSDNTDRDMPPDITKRQISTVIKLQDGDRAIIGGLITSSDHFNERKVPLLGDIPILGYAFRATEKINSVSELVIIITPTIIKSDKSLTLKDLNYKKATLE